ncbi:MAG TPA: LuxR C-terminal-related transcriptional regulator, partial [Rhizomicrobium sp.]|nr:LuxR C-terminal-related transcriptional regulator [Rhizomicrobium sp.]
LDLQRLLAGVHEDLKIVILTGLADIPTVLEAMRAGAVDFLQKPFTGEQLIASVNAALRLSQEAIQLRHETAKAVEQLATLTPRERDVLEKITRGRSNKVAAHELNISPRTVECHRANIMQKLRVSGLHELVRIADTAGRFGKAVAGREDRAA